MTFEIKAILCVIKASKILIFLHFLDSFKFKMHPIWRFGLAAFGISSLLGAFGVLISAPMAPRFTPDLSPFRKSWILN